MEDNKCCADCGRPLDGQNCSAGGVHDVSSVEKESWLTPKDVFMLEYVEHNDNIYQMYGSVVTLNKKKMEEMVDRLLQSDRQAVREKVEGMRRSVINTPYFKTPIQDGKDESYNQALSDVLKFLSDDKE